MDGAAVRRGPCWSITSSSHLSNLYGTFATVLGLIWWLALGAMVTVYAAEFNVVLVPASLAPVDPRDIPVGSAAGAASTATAS